MNTSFRHRFLFLTPAALFLAVCMLATSGLRAQYFISRNVEHKVLKASGRDSVILLSTTPFAVPAVKDSVSMTYHEPMPDSIMPRSAVVVGTISVQAENGDDVAPMLEKYARKLGADWIVSFQEPKPSKTKDGWIVYRSQATLLHVLDDQFIAQNDIAYSYYEDQHFPNYAAVSHWFDLYGKGFGAKIDPPKTTDK